MASQQPIYNAYPAQQPVATVVVPPTTTGPDGVTTSSASQKVPVRYWAYLGIGIVSIIIGAIMISLYSSSIYCSGGYCYYYTGYKWSGIFMIIFGVIEVLLALYYIYAWKKNPPAPQVSYVTQPTQLTVYPPQPQSVIVQQPVQTSGYYYAAADPAAAQAAMNADRGYPQQSGQPVYLPAYTAQDPYAVPGSSSAPGSYLKQ